MGQSDDERAGYKRGRAEAKTEIERLRQALFAIQCEQLARATNDELSDKRHRQLAMATRDRIITILAPQQRG